MMKQRLDVLMMERGLADSQSRAQALIMAGQVMVAAQRVDKPGMLFAPEVEIEVKQLPRFVSRAGEKLASVAEALNLEFGGKVVVDVGSSTGGFTDYALQHGAQRVYCVDVGTGQLSYRLRQDARVVVMERTDVRVVQLPELADMAVMDVSFISALKVMEAVARLVKPGGEMIVMAKPQFEAGKAVADRYRGVIPVGAVRDEVLADLEAGLAAGGFSILVAIDSAVAGAEGNVERFYKLVARGAGETAKGLGPEAIGSVRAAQGVWLGQPLKQTNLVLLRRGTEVLLAMKKRGFGAGRWNGTGGKVKAGESMEAAARRETEEEIGVQVQELRPVAELEFYFVAANGRVASAIRTAVYECWDWQGEPVESEEMAPRWFELEDIPYGEMWSDDRHWLPQLLAGHFIWAEFLFNDQDEMLDREVRIGPGPTTL